jgi:hypothetical protein
MLFGVPIWLWICFLAGTAGTVVPHLMWALCFNKYIWNQERAKDILGEEFIERYQIK